VNADLKIVLEAPGGHRAHYILSRSELPDQTTLSRDPDRAARERLPVGKSYDGAMQVQEPKIIKEAVAEVLESNLKPITAMLLTQQRMLVELKEQGPSFRDVVGGIGWIMGLVGLAAYFLSRSGKG
jgi:nickel transport protein